MKIKVSKIQKVGYAMVKIVSIDGIEYSGFLAQLSRKLTNTSTEEGLGIFNHGTVQFARHGSAKVWVNLEKWEEPEDCMDIVRAMVCRAEMVRKAFADKYPEFELTAEIEYNPAL